MHRLVVLMTCVSFAGLAACGSAAGSRAHARDSTEVRVYRPDQPWPTIAEELSFPRPNRALAAANEQELLRHRFRFFRVPKRVQPAALVEWTSRYPFAAQGLRDWVARHPVTAAILFDRAVNDSERVEALTGWAITNPDERLESFLLLHGGWDFLRPFMRGPRRRALEGYLGWCRKSPDAAAELVHHPKGLAWAREHLFANELGTRRSQVAQAR
jgi:hypothetical protein